MLLLRSGKCKRLPVYDPTRRAAVNGTFNLPCWFKAQLITLNLEVCIMPESTVSLLTIDQAAEVLTLSPWTIRAWIKAGRLPVVRLGRRIAIERTALESLINAGRSCKAAQAA